jgi:hypothetical protein
MQLLTLSSAGRNTKMCFPSLVPSTDPSVGTSALSSSHHCLAHIVVLSPLPPYVCMAWYSIKHKANFSHTLHFL